MNPNVRLPQRLAGLTSLVFLIITLVGATLEGNLPSAGTSTAKVVSYYTTHQSNVKAATVLFGISLVFALLFFGALRARLARDAHNEWLTTVGLGAGVLLAVAGTAEFSLDYALADNIHHIDPGTVQAINIAASGGLITAAVAIGTACLTFGIAIITGRQLPRWLGWTAFVIGALSLAGGATEPISEPLFFAWMAVTGITMAIRERKERISFDNVIQPVH
jgi:hypothetical protein